MAELRVLKSARRLELWGEAGLVKAYAVSLGAAPAGDKEREGDGRTPEGRFYVCTRKADSKFHRFLGLSYPDAADAERGLREGLIDEVQRAAILEAQRAGARPPWDTALGGMIGVHGTRPGAEGDWTQGCIALADADMDELWEACPLGARVEVLP